MEETTEKPVSEPSQEEEVMWHTLAKEVTVEMPEGQKSNMPVHLLQGNPLPQNLLVSEEFIFFFPNEVCYISTPLN